MVLAGLPCLRLECKMFPSDEQKKRNSGKEEEKELKTVNEGTSWDTHMANECAQGENEKVCRASFRVCVLYSTIFTVLCNRTSLVWVPKRKKISQHCLIQKKKRLTVFVVSSVFGSFRITVRGTLYHRLLGCRASTYTWVGVRKREQNLN